MSTLAAAIEWAGHGIPVVCCAGKNPGRLLGEGWQHQATTDPQTIKAWWVKWPNANVGIVPGRRLLPIDVDQPDEFKRFEAEHGPAPPTPRYLTNGEPGVPRERLLLRHPWCDLKDKLAPGVQLRDDNLMSVVPPSLNPDSGEHYEWLTSPDEVPFAAMSTAWLKRAAVPENRFAKYTNGGPAPPIGDRIPKGVQHDTLVSFAGTMRRRGATADEIFAALMVMNQRCERPGPETNIRRIAESVAKYPPAAAAATPDVPAAGGHGRHG
jgi:hypothetical protein